jgi:hypothetical protein
MVKLAEILKFVSYSNHISKIGNNFSFFPTKHSFERKPGIINQREKNHAHIKTSTEDYENPVYFSITGFKKLSKKDYL